MDIEKLIVEMTVEEKAALVSGTNFMYTNAIPRLGVPAVETSDGPHGLRKQIGGADNGISQSLPSTAFPTAVTTASSWNPENTRKMGEAIAAECRYYGVNVLLGPGANIKRNPRCGRNFEYFSEDPVLSGTMAAAEVVGLQSQGVGACVKHFALNNAENFRFMGNSVADIRAMRELYLKSFEIIVKQAHPYSVMCAYNQINGTYCSENKWLLTDILRKEWGFDGVVMTDWGAMHNRVESLKAGLDLEMPGDTDICRKWIIDGVKDGILPMSVLNQACSNILKLAEKVVGTEKCDPNFEAHNRLAAAIAEDSAVLMKNDGTLPLSSNEKLLVVGELFEKMRYQGAGSSMINPTGVTTPKAAFDNLGINYIYAKGYSENKTEAEQASVDQAVAAAESYETVLVFCGLTDWVESEGCDRDSISLPQNQIALVEALTKLNKKVVVVLFGGSVVELPFAENVNAILNMFLPGQNGGTACANLLFGKANPCGKLSETWVQSYSDVPFGEEYSTTLQEVYKESVFVGYRYYQTAGVPVAFPFGFGLSYTTFAYSNLKVTNHTDKIEISCTVANTGKVDGAEVVQIYVAAPQGGIFKPQKELKAFAKVYLKAGESKTVNLEIVPDDLRYFDIEQNRWVLEQGNYQIQVCRNVQQVELSATVALDGETPKTCSQQIAETYGKAHLYKVTDAVFEQMAGIKIPPLPPTKPITLESRFSNLAKTGLMGKILFNAVLSVAKKQHKKAMKMPEGREKDNSLKGALFLKRILESNSLISMSMCAGKSCPYNFAQGFAAFANGRLFKGIRCFCTKIKVPPLPQNQK